MRLMLVLTIGILASYLPLVSAQTKVVIYFNQSHPPYNYVDADAPSPKLTGIYVDILQEIDRRLEDYTFELKPVPWPRAKKLIELGQGFGFVAPYYHGHDWPYVWPYSLPIMLEQVVLLCQSERLKATRETWPDDFAGLIIGNNTGFDGFGGPIFRRFLAEGKIQMDESSKGTRGNLEKLFAGRNDCYMGNSGSVAWEIKKLKADGRWDDKKVSRWGFISSDAIYIGYTDRDKGKFTYKRDLTQKIDNILYKMHKSGKIRAIAHEYLASIGLPQEVIDVRPIVGN